MEKKKITELNAVAAVMDSIFQQVDERWGVIWLPAEQALRESGVKLEKSEFIKFNFSLAAIAINFRSAFDLFPPAQAERLFTILQQLLKDQFGEGQAFVAVRNAVIKYIEAYNNGVLKIRNPVLDVSMLLYYKIGLQNTAQKVVDETYYVPEPEMVDLLTRSLTMFLGKWDILLERFEVVNPAREAAFEEER
ncbi:MAG: hypothetical protein IPP17_12715 [Bacteroidetes bacterium]|jgi:hypothetical protein|nr:hypothetical protein [Bacteroidota bacterium]